MFGIFLTAAGTLLEELGTLISKQETMDRHESMYTMGFLNITWMTVGFALIALIVPGSFMFQIESWPTFLARVVLEIVQSYVTILAIVRASRSAFGFLRTLTIPLLLGVDVMLGYYIAPLQIVAISIVALVLLLLFLNHGIEKKGTGLVVFSAVNSVATISLYKYDITYYNSVVAEQLLILLVLLAYFFVMASLVAKEQPLKFLRRPRFFLQSASMGIGGGLDSFAYMFAPASIIVAAKRSSGILWSVLSGNHYFHERYLVLKLLGFAGLTAALILLAIGT